MTLLTQLLPKAPPVHQEPKKRGHRQRKPSRAAREQRDLALTAEIKAKLAAWDRQQAEEQTELAAKASVLPDGVRVVGLEQEGQSGQKRNDSKTGSKVIDLMSALKAAITSTEGQAR